MSKLQSRKLMSGLKYDSGT